MLNRMNRLFSVDIEELFGRKFKIRSETLRSSYKFLTDKRKILQSEQEAVGNHALTAYCLLLLPTYFNCLRLPF
jgi:hypothetical protein